jgi:hypothetical protein
MAGPNEPKNETVRIDLPLPTAAETPGQNIKETVRIQLPLREAMSKPPSFSPALSASVSPAPDPPVSGPKNETVRIPLVPNPLPSGGQMKKTQSRIPIPNVAPQNSLIALAARDKDPMLLWWILLGISALILIIQIWTYLS